MTTASRLTSRRSQPPLALAVPLSRFTSRVGGGSAFYVRLLMIPRKVWIWSATLSSVRFLAFLGIYANQSHDAQWQLSYFPLWVVDFPISVAYFVCPIPF